MRRTIYMLVAIVAICAAVGLNASAAHAVATVDSFEITCRNFAATGTTDSPFYVVQIYDNDADEDLLFGAYPTPEGGVFSFDLSWVPAEEGTDLEVWVWGSPTDDPDDWDGDDYFFTEGVCETPPEVLYGPLEVSGVATCSADETQTVSWVAAHPLGVAPPDTGDLAIVLDGATATGAATGAVALSPSTIEVGGTATGETAVAAGATGSVTLSITAHYDLGEDFASTGTVALANCAAPTTTATAAAAAAVAPRFTG